MRVSTREWATLSSSHSNRCVLSHSVCRVRGCNCKKSKCLKLYCDCFAGKMYCTPSCNCQNCINDKDHALEVGAAQKLAIDRNSAAFQQKIHGADGEKIKNTHSHTRVYAHSQCAFGGAAVQSIKAGTLTEFCCRRDTGTQAKHITGCNCKKSNCTKNYCECFQSKVACTDACRCLNCKNCGADSAALLQGHRPPADMSGGYDHAPEESSSEEDGYGRPAGGDDGGGDGGDASGGGRGAAWQATSPQAASGRAASEGLFSLSDLARAAVPFLSQEEDSTAGQSSTEQRGETCHRGEKRPAETRDVESGDAAGEESDSDEDSSARQERKKKQRVAAAAERERRRARREQAEPAPPRSPGSQKQHDDESRRAGAVPGSPNRPLRLSPAAGGSPAAAGAVGSHPDLEQRRHSDESSGELTRQLTLLSSY